MNVIGNMHEVRFSNISILSHIVCYIPPLTIIIALTLKAVDQIDFQEYIRNALWGYQILNIFLFGFVFYFRLRNLLLHD